jgi:hypothetical protein
MTTDADEKNNFAALSHRRPAVNTAQTRKLDILHLVNRRNNENDNYCSVVWLLNRFVR